MASGTAIVAADHSSLHEVLSDGSNAILVEPDQPLLLAKALERLMGDSMLLQKLGEQARKDAAQYTWKARADRLTSFIDSLTPG